MIPEFEPLEVWPVKEFAPYKVLPVGIYDCDESDVYADFVEAFPSSTSRIKIYDGFTKLRKEALNNGFQITQWVDGSFVSSKTDPDDIDIVSFIDYDDSNQLTASQMDFLTKVLNGREATKANYQTHTFLVPACDSSHPYFPVFEKTRQYWLKTWGNTYEDKNTGSSVEKGFLKMVVGTGPHPQISEVK